MTDLVLSTAALPATSEVAQGGRRLTPGAVTPHPLADLLPAMFADDDFALRFCAGLDDVLTPVLVLLDCFDSYLDPALAPGDFVDWLAGWVGIALDRNWPEEKRRALVAHAVELYRWHGTERGLVEYLRLYTGVEPEVTDSGGATWSAVAGAPMPGERVPEVRVRLVLDADSPVDERAVEAIVRSAKPAHVRHRLEVTRAAPSEGRAPR